MINRKYKDTVFRMLFGSEEYKENTLALYNAMNGSNYTDPAELEITTIQDVIYMGIKNDVSFIVGDEMNLWEHQSTFNPNMPLRGLFYFARLYESYIANRGMSVYRKKALELPTPRYVVFYIGPGEKEERRILRLSELFLDNDPAIEVTATVININQGFNKSLMRTCQTLEEYSTLIHEIRKRQKEGKNHDDAVKEAVDYCITNGILRDFLLKNKSEVTDMILTEFNEEEYREIIKQEAREEGLEEGRAEGQAQIVRHLLGTGKTETEIIELTGLSQETVHSILEGKFATVTVI